MPQPTDAAPSAYLGKRKDQKLSTCTQEMLVEFRNARAQVVANRTANADIDVLSIALNYAVAKDLLFKNPASAIKPLPVKTKSTAENPGRRPFTQRELELSARLRYE